MKVLDLRCHQGHAFEGWFGSEQDYQDQRQRGLLECPMCGSSQVLKGLSAPRIQRGSRSNEAQYPASVSSFHSETRPHPQSPRVPQEVSALMDLARNYLAQVEDVGSRFAEEARRMHRGDAPERSIRGRASKIEAEQLREEGIPVLALPPAAAETLH